MLERRFVVDKLVETALVEGKLSWKDPVNARKFLHSRRTLIQGVFAMVQHGLANEWKASGDVVRFMTGGVNPGGAHRFRCG